MDYFIYFLGFFLINMATNVGVPEEHRVKLFSQDGVLQQLLIIAGALCIINTHVN
jgi:hypothetical protein